MKNDFAFKKGSLVANESVGVTSDAGAKGKGANVTLPGGADQGNGIEDFGAGKGMSNSALNFSADVKVVG